MLTPLWSGAGPSRGHWRQPEDPVQLLAGQRPVTGRNRAEDLGVQINLVQRHAIVDTKIWLLWHRAHLHHLADKREDGT